MTGRSRTRGWVTVGSLLVLLGALTVGVGEHWAWLTEIDRSVAKWGHDATYGYHERSELWIDVAAVGQPLVLRAAMLLVAVWLALRRQRRWAVWVVAVVVGENLVAPLAKLVLDRKRPTWVHPITVEHSLSYPSGHATAAAALTVVFVIVAITQVRREVLRGAVITASVSVGLIVSVDRIFLAVHYLSDVLAGDLLGAVVALAGFMFLRTRDRR